MPETPDTEVPETDHPDAPEVQAVEVEASAADAAADASASELIAAVKEADRAGATAILNQENARPLPRVTVLRAAEQRLIDLDQPGERLDSVPDGAWAQLLNGNGDPVTRDGGPVSVPLEV